MTEKTYNSIFDAIHEGDAEKSAEMQFRSDLLLMLRKHFDGQGWGQTEIMENLAIPQSRASELQREKITKFSSEKLIGYLAKLGFTFKASFTTEPKTIEVRVEK